MASLRAMKAGAKKDPAEAYVLRMIAFETRSYVLYSALSLFTNVH